MRKLLIMCHVTLKTRTAWKPQVPPDTKSAIQPTVRPLKDFTPLGMVEKKLACGRRGETG
jgi:hypothetical protein